MNAQQHEPVPTALAKLNSFWIHGAGLAGDTWDAIRADLPLALTPDLPGHGQMPLVDPPSVERFALTLIDQVPQDAVLIGHSLGGMVALELAALLEGRVAALVLIEAVPTVRDTLSARMSARIATAVFKAVPSAWFTHIVGIGQAPATRAELKRQTARMDRQRLVATLDAAAAYDGRPHLAGISVPTLIIVGRDNKATHRGAALMHKRITGAQMITLPGGHMLHTDNPTGLRQAIEDFVRSEVTQSSAP
ncbi:MAG: alpha/beta hydrolase [Pseudomonadota bacterium]